MNVWFNNVFLSHNSLQSILSMQRKNQACIHNLVRKIRMRFLCAHPVSFVTTKNVYFPRDHRTREASKKINGMNRKEETGFVADVRHFSYALSDGKSEVVEVEHTAKKKRLCTSDWLCSITFLLAQPFDALNLNFIFENKLYNFNWTGLHKKRNTLKNKSNRKRSKHTNLSVYLCITSNGWRVVLFCFFPFHFVFVVAVCYYIFYSFFCFFPFNRSLISGNLFGSNSITWNKFNSIWFIFIFPSAHISRVPLSNVD